MSNKNVIFDLRKYIRDEMETIRSAEQHNRDVGAYERMWTKQVALLKTILGLLSRIETSISEGKQCNFESIYDDYVYRNV